VTGVFLETSVDLTMARGKGRQRTGEFTVAESQSVCEEDAFLIDQQRWEVSKIGSPNGGGKVIYMRRYEGETKAAKLAGDM
jgi:hypothetical protein